MWTVALMTGGLLIGTADRIPLGHPIEIQGWGDACGPVGVHRVEPGKHTMPETVEQRCGRQGRFHTQTSSEKSINGGWTWSTEAQNFRSLPGERTPLERDILGTQGSSLHRQRPSPWSEKPGLVRVVSGRRARTHLVGPPIPGLKTDIRNGNLHIDVGDTEATYVLGAPTGRGSARPGTRPMGPGPSPSERELQRTVQASGPRFRGVLSLPIPDSGLSLVVWTTEGVDRLQVRPANTLEYVSSTNTLRAKWDAHSRCVQIFDGEEPVRGSLWVAAVRSAARSGKPCPAKLSCNLPGYERTGAWDELGVGAETTEQVLTAGWHRNTLRVPENADALLVMRVGDTRLTRISVPIPP